MVGAAENGRRDGPEIRGVAGYESPYPYMEKLQPRMDERLERRVPVNGRFCGFCFGRLGRADEVCPYCAARLADTGTVDQIPQEVLRIFNTKKKTEERWVHLGAFAGLLIAMALFVYLVVWGPGLLGHPAAGFAVLILGGYLLAQLFGPILAGQIGYRKGSEKRDRMWSAFLASRSTGDGGAARPDRD